jgi:hypothetical protein
MHDRLQDGKYPEANGTKVLHVPAGTMGKIVDTSFTKDGMLQFHICFTHMLHIPLVVPYNKVELKPYERVK